MPRKSATNQYFYAIGRRKSSVAIVKLFPNKGESTINNQPVAKYFPETAVPSDLEKPLKIAGLTSKYSYAAKVSGGGFNGQKEALSLALSRAIQKSDSDQTQPLRAAGLLTVDSRVRQKRMIGTGGKARRQKQSPKR
jgi:small subunit ribosomal protein S9